MCYCVPTYTYLWYSFLITVHIFAFCAACVCVGYHCHHGEAHICMMKRKMKGILNNVDAIESASI